MSGDAWRYWNKDPGEEGKYVEPFHRLPSGFFDFVPPHNQAAGTMGAFSEALESTENNKPHDQGETLGPSDTDRRRGKGNGRLGQQFDASNTWTRQTYSNVDGNDPWSWKPQPQTGNEGISPMELNSSQGIPGGTSALSEIYWDSMRDHLSTDKGAAPGLFDPRNSSQGQTRVDEYCPDCRAPITGIDRKAYNNNLAVHRATPKCAQRTANVKLGMQEEFWFCSNCRRRFIGNSGVPFEKRFSLHLERRAECQEAGAYPTNTRPSA